jgi:hypothetical protein
MNKTLKIISLIAASFAVGAGAQASDKALVNALVKKGYITQEEAQSISKDAMISPSGAKSTSSITFGGMVQGQYDYLKSNTKDIGTTGLDFESADTKTLQREKVSNHSLRRVKLAVDARLNKDWSASLGLGNTATGVNEGNTPQTTSAQSYIELENATISYNGLEDHVFSFGYDSPCFGLENTSSSAHQKTLEASIAARFFDQGIGLGRAAVGLFAAGSFLDGFYYNAAITRASGINSHSFSDPYTNNPSLYGRLGYMYTWNEWNFDLGLDLCFVRGTLDKPYNTTYDFVLGAPNTLTPTAGTAGHDTKVLGAGLYLKTSYRDFSMDADLMIANIKNARINDKAANPWGLTLTPSYKFMDGKYELVARYSYVDAGKARFGGKTGLAGAPGSIIHPAINKHNVSTPQVNALNSAGDFEAGELPFNKFHQFYIGGNWYIMGNDVKLTAGYDYTMAKDATGFSDAISAATKAAFDAANLAGKDSKFYVHHFGVRLQLLF